ncbi:MAG: DUF1302 domain-containing protein [Burkholderiaceae bacterium]|nr:DUF1302 domain-containing protein [Burkholderiaceae bacterium]
MDQANQQDKKHKGGMLRPRTMVQACGLALAAMSLAYAPQAAAENFTLDNGDQGQWSAGLSFGDAWRTTNPDPALYSPVYNNGGRYGRAGDGNQVGDLNFGKGASISAPITINGEVQLKHDNLGFVLGARAWYDETLETHNMARGNMNNGYVPNSKLNDSGFYPGTKFEDAVLTNAYVFGNFEPIEGKPLNVKLGDQVVNWGESLFIPGINSFGAFNYQALVTPGATIKDALLPIPQIDANWGLGDGLSLEGFYQFTWVKSVLPGCGTYWSISDIYNCGGSSGPLLGDSTGTNQYAQLNGLTPLTGLMAQLGVPNYAPNFRVGSQPDIKAKNSGQAGLSLHYYADSIETDFGFYAAAYNPRTPDLDLYRVATADPQSFFSGTFNGAPVTSLLALLGGVAGKAQGLATQAGQAAQAAQAAAAAGNAAAAAQYAAGAQAAAAGAKQLGAAAQALGNLVPLVTPVTAGWDYSGSTIKEFGISAATTIGGWAVGGEVSISKDVPVQLNPGDMVVGYIMGNPLLGKALGATGAALNGNAGPLASWATVPMGTILKGYDLHNKVQVQANTSKVFSQVAGAESLTLVGEIGIEKWSGISDPNTPGNLRYGRGFAYGYANPGTPGGGAVCAILNNPGASQGYCNATGFDTPSDWGYRVMAELSYPDVIAGWNLKPRVFWSQDVHGYSADGIFSQNREVLGLTMRADYNNKYYAQITYTTFNHDATYDVLHDRDNIAIVGGINF